MKRVIATLPETVEELCLLRLGILARSASAWWFARRLRSAIAAESRRAATEDAGLLGSEFFAFDLRHFGVLQYWRSFEALEAWSHTPPHSEWWRRAVERMRTKGDLGVYHETFLVPAGAIESIYMNCPPVGLATFGTLGEPVGMMTNSRGRLGRGRQD
jgi:hypothetical protein